MNLKELRQKLEENTGEELFGKQGTSHPDYKDWALLCHPDLNRTEEAREVFLLLKSKAEGGSDVLEIHAPDGSVYKMKKKPESSDEVADMFLAAHKKFMFRVGKTEGMTSYLNHERIILSTLIEPDTANEIKCLFPNLVNSFTVKPKNWGARHVNVYEHDPLFLPCNKIVGKAHNWASNHVAWIIKRLLLIVGHAQTHGMVCANITPQNMVLDGKNRKVMIQNWCHTVNHGEKICAIQKSSKDFYPSEVLNKEAATFETDIYMVGKVGLHLLESCIDNKVKPQRRFFQALTIPQQKRRPQDALGLYDDYSDLLEKHFGPASYERLIYDI